LAQRPELIGREQRYWLLLTLRRSSGELATFKPIGQAMPRPDAQS
jgi:hypothetical protein